MSTQTEPKLVTQIDFARAGQITPQMKEVAEREHRDPEYIRERVADGRIAIPANIVHIKKGMRAFGVGEGLSTKVNVNLGISGDKADAAEEWKKVKIAEDFGADAIMDLSNSGKTRQFRQQLIDETPLMVGTVPMYDAIGGAISASSGADFLCYVTPAEHLCLPNAQDVLDGLMATKIAAHAADIAKKVPHARDMDDKMGQARRKLDWDAMWKCALDPVTGKKRYEESPAATEGTCTMCGKMCAVRTVNKVFEGTTIDLGMED